MKNKKIWFVLQSLVGIILLMIGAFVLKTKDLKTLSGLCFGIGAAMATLGIGWFIQALIVPAIESEKIKKQKKIEVNDERNTRIRQKTGYMVAKIMNYLFLAFILMLSFMNVDKLIINMAVFLIVIKFILVVYFSNYYTKKM
jgi:large-conductance mechanosensitive channel